MQGQESKRKMPKRVSWDKVCTKGLYQVWKQSKRKRLKFEEVLEQGSGIQVDKRRTLVSLAL